jgi:hypothetical protein
MARLAELKDIGVGIICISGPQYSGLVRMPFQTEMTVDQNLNGRELLQGLDVPEFRHHPFPPSKRLR